MKLDRSFGSSKLSPWEQRKAKIDCCGVQCIRCCIEVDFQFRVGVKRARGLNQALSEIGIDSPVARLVGIGQRGAFDRTSEATVVELSTLRAKTDFDIAKALAIG